MLIIGCSGSRELARKVAKKLHAEYSNLIVEKFPDNEIKIRLPRDVANRKVVLIQSFYGSINDKLIELLFAAHTARELGAKKLILVAPYLAYFRQDKRFKERESISANIVAKFLAVFDKILVVDPHLHRIKRLKKLADFFAKGIRLSAVKEIANYIKKLKLGDCVIIGPDEESKQWAGGVAKLLRKKVVLLLKKRLGSRKVKISALKADIKGKNAIIVDDIISTGRTMLDVVKKVKAAKAKEIFCIAIHGIFAEGALKKIQKYAKVISCNTIPSKVARIDVSGVIADALKRC